MPELIATYPTPSLKLCRLTHVKIYGVERESLRVQVRDGIMGVPSVPNV